MRFHISTTNPDDMSNIRISLKALAYHLVVGHATPEYFDQAVAALEGVIGELEKETDPIVAVCVYGEILSLNVKPCDVRAETLDFIFCF